MITQVAGIQDTETEGIIDACAVLKFKWIEKELEEETMNSCKLEKALTRNVSIWSWVMLCIKYGFDGHFVWCNVTLRQFFRQIIIWKKIQMHKTLRQHMMLLIDIRCTYFWWSVQWMKSVCLLNVAHILIDMFYKYVFLFQEFLVMNRDALKSNLIMFQQNKCDMWLVIMQRIVYF